VVREIGGIMRHDFKNWGNALKEAITEGGKWDDKIVHGYSFKECSLCEYAESLGSVDECGFGECPLDLIDRTNCGFGSQEWSHSWADPNEFYIMLGMLYHEYYG
jgi:hypothetical protein